MKIPVSLNPPKLGCAAFINSPIFIGANISIPSVLLDFDRFAKPTDYCVLWRYEHVAYQKKRDEILFFLFPFVSMTHNWKTQQQHDSTNSTNERPFETYFIRKFGSVFVIYNFFTRE